jgi:hypothetical protein
VRLFSTHFHPPGSKRAGRPPVLVKEGISWPCLFLGWIGLLLAGSWISALLAGAVGFLLLALLRPVSGAWPVLAGLQVLIALFANDLRRWELRLHGLVPGPVVGGRDSDAALLRLLDRRPELVGKRA